MSITLGGGKAWCLADHALVIPETVNRLSDGLACTNLVGYVERGWCCVQLLCVLHLGESQAMCASIRDGCRMAYTMMIGGGYDVHDDDWWGVWPTR